MLLTKIMAVLLMNLSECSFRLVNEQKDTITSENVRGLLLYNGGTVCDDGFSDNSASAICIELGFNSARSWKNGRLWSSLQNSLSINLDDVECSSPSWSSCSYQSSHNCDHYEDVFLTCSYEECPAGQYGAIATSCTNCPVNTYKSEVGIRENCDDCPEESTSIAGSTFCSCEGGQYWQTSQCSICSNTTVSQSGALTCTPCPESSVPILGQTSCSCGVGQVWTWSDQTHGSCMSCPENTYKSEGMDNCASCPQNGSSGEGAGSCSCVEGMFWNTSNQCQSCEPGTFKNQDMVTCQQCEGSSVSPEGAASCLECPPASRTLKNRSVCECPVGREWQWSNVSFGSCVLCQEGTFRNETMPSCEKCGPWSASMQGSEMCICFRGTYKNQLTQLCTMCPSGTSLNKESDHCICPAGRYWNKTACNACVEGTVSPMGSLECQECPQGAIAVADGSACSCPAGTEWTWDKENRGFCQECRKNTYRNSATSSCVICPVHLTSEVRSDHCICPPGQYWNKTTCEACKEGAVSQEGALKCQECPKKSAADPSRRICKCDGNKEWIWDKYGVGSCELQVGGQFTISFSEILPHLNILIGLLVGVLILLVTPLVVSFIPWFWQKRQSKGRSRVVYKVNDPHSSFSDTPESEQANIGEQCPNGINHILDVEEDSSSKQCGKDERPPKEEQVKVPEVQPPDIPVQEMDEFCGSPEEKQEDGTSENIYDITDIV